MSNRIKFTRIRVSRALKLLRQAGIGTVRGRAFAAVVFTAAISIFAAALALPSKIMANDTDVRTFIVDVAFSNPYFQNNVDPAETEKNPLAFSQGDTFIQDGVIYPAYTIPRGKTEFDPDTHPGAIGKYRARGTWTTNLERFVNATEKTGPTDPDMAFATELFSFQQDRSSIMTDGILPNANFSAHRVVLGGTRTYRDFVGEVHEDNIGENVLGFCNLRVTFKIRKAADSRWR